MLPIFLKKFTNPIDILGIMVYDTYIDGNHIKQIGNIRDKKRSEVTHEKNNKEKRHGANVLLLYEYLIQLLVN